MSVRLVEYNIPVSMLLHPLCALPRRPLPEPNIQIRARAEYPPVARHHDALDARVGIEHGVRGLDLAAHRVREGIVLARAEQGQGDDAGLGLVVVRADARPGLVEVIVGVRQGDVGHMAGGDLTRCHGVLRW